MNLAPEKDDYIEVTEAEFQEFLEVAPNYQRQAHGGGENYVEKKFSNPLTICFRTIGNHFYVHNSFFTVHGQKELSRPPELNPDMVEEKVRKFMEYYKHHPMFEVWYPKLRGEIK